MTKSIIRGVQRTRPSRHRPHLWSGVPLTAMTIVLAAFVGLPGCDKPPTWSELVNGKKKEEPPPPKVVATPAPQAAPVVPPKAPEKPKRSPQEVIAEFNAMPSQLHTDAQLGELASLPEAVDQFTELNLSGSPVSDVGLAYLPRFERVEKLSISGCQFSNTALAGVARMKSLTSLSMDWGAPKDATCDKGLASIKEMHQLTSLSLERANVTMAGLSNVAEMTWLESLNVARTRFNDDSLQLLAPLVNLKELDISFTTVSDNGFRLLAPFHQLETLNVAGAPIHGEGLKKLGQAGAAPKLRSLAIYSTALDLTGYEGIFSFRRTLESLDVGQASLDDNRFIHAVAPLSKLETLLVHDNPGLTDASMIGWPRLKRLKRLYFFRNSGISDNTLTQLAKVKSLESLTLNETACSERGASLLKRKLKNCEIIFNGKKIE